MPKGIGYGKINTGMNQMKKSLGSMTKPMGANKTPFHQRKPSPGLAQRAMGALKSMLAPTPKKNAFQHLKRGPGSPAGGHLKRNMKKK